MNLIKTETEVVDGKIQYKMHYEDGSILYKTLEQVRMEQLCKIEIYFTLNVSPNLEEEYYKTIFNNYEKTIGLNFKNVNLAKYRVELGEPFSSNWQIKASYDTEISRSDTTKLIFGKLIQAADSWDLNSKIEEDKKEITGRSTSKVKIDGIHSIIYKIKLS